MGAAGSPEIYLSGVDRDAFAALDGATPSAVRVAWSDAGAIVTLISAGASTQFRSRTAMVHEPRPQLYEGLPLVGLDDAARRFWRRVFLMARIPGGRRLLRWIAQRTRRRLVGPGANCITGACRLLSITGVPVYEFAYK